MTEPITEQVSETPAATEAVVETDNSNDVDVVLDKLLARDFPEVKKELPKESPSSTDAEYQKALRALQRDGVPSDVIDGMKSNPEKIREWGLRAAKRQADVDAFGARMSEQRKDGGSSAQKDDSIADNRSPNTASTQENPQTNLFAKSVTKDAADMQERMDKILEERTRAMEIRLESQVAYQSIRSEYGASAPAYEALMAEAAAIGQREPAAYESVDAILRAAARRISGEPKKNDVRDIGRPNPSGIISRALPNKADPDEVALDILFAGGSKDDVRKALTK